MTLLEKWKRIPFPYKAAATMSLLMIVIAGLVIALVFSSSAKDRAAHAARNAQVAAANAQAAAAEAKAEAACVNNTLGDRNTVTARDQAAHIAFSVAQKTFANASQAWAYALNRVIAQRPGSNAQARAYGEFISVNRDYVTAAAAFSTAARRYAATLVADQKLRDKYPLGRC